MKKTIVLLAALLQSAIVFAETAVSLKSSSGKLSADIEAAGQVVRIDLYEVQSKVVDIKTLRPDLAEDVMRGDWVVAGEARETVDQTWQPLYGERALVTDRYNELKLSRMN